MRRKREIALENDIELLISRMQTAKEGSFDLISTEGFNDPRLADCYNEVLKAVLANNTGLVMALNQSMRKIGDSSVVKNMVEKVNVQQGEIEALKGAGEVISDSAKEIKQAASDMKQKSLDINDIVSDCRAKITGSIEAVDESVKDLDGLIMNIASFKEKAEEISSIAEAVKSIAGTSNLLALNASIEAARAGEAGRGFAVVAEEIRSLAVSTTASADDIGKQIQEIVNDIGALSDVVEGVSESIKKGNEDCHNSLNSFEDVRESMSILSEEIDSVANEISNQSQSTSEFANAVDQMARNYLDLYDECMNTGSHMYKISRDVDKTRSDFARKNSALTVEDWLTVFEVDHLIFTWRQYNNICGFEKLLIEQVNNPDGCKLGKWIAARTEPMKSSKELAEVKRCHYALHKYATEAWEFVQNGDREAAMDRFGGAYKSYEELMKAMDALRTYVKKNNIQ